MTFPLSNNRSALSDAYRNGSSSASMRHLHPHQHQRHHTNSAGGKSKNDDHNGGNELIVNKLQNVISAIRKDRNLEHRNRENAMGKLRSAKEACEQDKQALKEDKSKFDATQNETKSTMAEILKLEESMKHVQDKYEFQHEDLIRKREKIQEQDSALAVTALKREKAISSAQTTRDQQRIKNKNLERKEEAKTVDFLAASLKAGINSRKKLKTSHNKTNNQFAGESVEKKSGADDFERLQNKLEIKEEEALRREFKSNVDYAMFPEMIEKKAKVLDVETEDIKIKATRFEAIIAELDNCADSYGKSFGSNSAIFPNSVVNNNLTPMLLQQHGTVNEHYNNLCAHSIDGKNIVIDSSKEVIVENTNLSKDSSASVPRDSSYDNKCENLNHDEESVLSVST